MKYSKLLCAAVAAVCATGASAQFNLDLKKLVPTKGSDYGVVYTLPETAIEITLQTVHTKRTPGEFFNYARRNLAIENAVTEPSTSVSVGAVQVRTVGVGNPSRRNMVQFKAGATPYVMLAPSGAPVSVNTQPAPAAAPAASTLEATPVQPTILETEFARQAMTPDMVKSSSMSKRAELAAARIFELRDMRSELIGGNAENPPADGKAMQLVLDNISGQERALTAMFAGTEQTWTSVRTVTFVPDSTGTATAVIARVSAIEGILDPDNLAGAPVTATLTLMERGSLPVNEKGEAKAMPKNAFAYAIPGTAMLTVSYEGNELISTPVTLAQLGVTFGLNPALFTDKKAPSKAVFDPATGALLELAPADPASL